MGRPKHVPDEILLSSLDTFWVEECHGIPAKLGAKSFSLYLQRIGHPVSDSALRHNRIITSKINSLKAEAEMKSSEKAAPAIRKDPAHRSDTAAINHDLSEKYQLMQKFIAETYVKGIYCHLVNEELSLTMESPVRPEAVKKDLVTVTMNPFTSPAVESLAKLFDLEGDENE